MADTAGSQRNGWGPKSELVQTLVRESPEYRNAVDKGQTPEEALQALLDDTAFLQKLRAEKTRVQAGFLAQDPVTGHVLAWVGSRDFAADPFDHVQAARRQPGSTFKPFVYGAAFAQGASPDDVLMDTAVVEYGDDGAPVARTLCPIRRHPPKAAASKTKPLSAIANITPALTPAMPWPV